MTYYLCFVLSSSSSASNLSFSFLPFTTFSYLVTAASYADLGLKVRNDGLDVIRTSEGEYYLVLSSFFLRISYSLISSLNRSIEVTKVSFNVNAYASCNVATLQCARPRFTSARPTISSFS